MPKHEDFDLFAVRPAILTEDGLVYWDQYEDGEFLYPEVGEVWLSPEDAKEFGEDALVREWAESFGGPDTVLTFVCRFTGRSAKLAPTLAASSRIEPVGDE